jgi:hypothetical protein
VAKRRGLRDSEATHRTKVGTIAARAATQADKADRAITQGKCGAAFKLYSDATRLDGIARAHFTSAEHPADLRKVILQSQERIFQAEDHFLDSCVRKK